MDLLLDLLIYLVVFCSFLFLLYSEFRIIYNRYLRSYKKEIREYLYTQNLDFVDSISPSSNDWKKSPFKEPNKIEFRFVYFRGIRWTKTEYLKIIACKNDKFQEFWVEIYTVYFLKPKLLFKEGNRIHKKDIESLDNVPIIVTDKCPACGFLISKNESICPDCGLNFA